MSQIAYVLTRKSRALECSLRLARLMKWEAFSEADLSDLDALFTKKYAAALSPEDRPIIVGLMQFVKRRGQWPILDGSYGYELLRKMLDTGRLFYAIGSHRRLRWGEPVEGSLAWQQVVGADGMWEPTVDTPAGFHAFALEPPIYTHGESNSCGLLSTPQPEKLVMRWLAARPMPAAEVSSFCLRLAKEFPSVAFPTPSFARLEEGVRVAPLAHLTLQQRALLDRKEREESWIDARDRLRLRLRFQYGKALIAWDAPEQAVSFREDGAIKRVQRDTAFEQAVLVQLAEWGFQALAQPSDLDFFNFDSSTFSLQPDHCWRRLLQDVFPQLDPQRWQVEAAAGLRLSVALESDLRSEIEESGEDSFALSIEARLEGRREPLLPALHRALRAKKGASYPEILAWLRDGDFALRLPSSHGVAWLALLPAQRLAQICDELYELFDKNPLGSGAQARVSRWRLGELAAAGLVDERCAEGVSAVARLCERLGSGIDVRERDAPEAFVAALRDYQRRGLGWLQALAEVDAGGILADDMGLGKTAQTIAHLVDLKQNGQLSSGALVIAPTSVIDNWEDELRRFAPTLEVRRFHGRDREAAWRESDAADVVLTTYALLRLEASRLCERRWSLVALDEAQNIKNAHSRTAIAARSLRAARKLCLTGTPIENRLEDIWSLFAFVLPGFLGDEDAFRARIAQPLKEAEDSAFAAELRERLKRRLAPFVLRRSKAEVLQDLPPRTEVTHAVAMTARQRDLYESFIAEARASIGASLATGGVAAARMLVLARLLRLRQICCDPRLLQEEGRDFDPADSAKLEALLDLLGDLVAQGSRVLVFSQFTSMLELIAAALRQEGIGHLVLTGATRKRAELVRAFQEGSDPVFLISLRAGGAGLNLTAADCVIHYDPWWNPAAERQASDRAHRMGQQKPVFVYRLIADESIESKIQRLQRSKLSLVENLLNEGDIDRLEIDAETIDYLLSD